MLSRRDVVGRLAAGAAAIWTVGIARSGLASVRSTEDARTGSGERDSASATVSAGEVQAPAAVPPPWEVVQPLASGTALGHGWRLGGLTEVRDGSCVLLLEHEQGRTQRVHLCRNDGRPQGLVYTRRFDLVVMNGGQGDLPTDEGCAQAVAAVAHALAANESDGRHAEVLAQLLSHAERVERFATAAKLR